MSEGEIRIPQPPRDAASGSATGRKQTPGPTPPPVEFLFPHRKRAFPLQTGAEIEAARPIGERRVLREQVMTIATSGSRADADSARSSEVALEFLRPRRWRPSGTRATPIPTVPPSPRSQPISAREVSPNSGGGAGNPPTGRSNQPAAVDNVIKRLWHDDLERRKVHREKAIEKALQRISDRRPETQHGAKAGKDKLKDSKENSPAKGANDVKRLTKRLVDDSKRRQVAHEKAIAKAMQPKVESKKLRGEEIDSVVQKVYTQAVTHHQAVREAQFRKLEPKPAPKLTAESQRAQSARLYDSGRRREREAMERALKKYLDDPLAASRRPRAPS